MPDSGGLEVVKQQHGRPPTLPMDASNSDSKSIDIQSTGTMTDVEEHMEVENVPPGLVNCIHVRVQFVILNVCQAWLWNII